MRPYGAWVATSRQRSGEPPSARQREDGIVAAHVADLMRGEVETASQPRRLPSVRLAPRDELAGLARVAPLLRAARDLGRWAERRAAVTRPVPPASSQPVQSLPARPELAQSPRVQPPSAQPRRPQPVHPRMFPAQPDSARPAVVDPMAADGRAGSDQGAALSLALETLADLGAVELGTEDGDGSLTVALSPLGTWGIHRRLRAQGWHVPVPGAARNDGAHGLLAALANCDAEDGEAEITAWLESRDPLKAAAELIEAAAGGSPGQRGAAFAVLDRIGLSALDQVRNALDRPLLRAHAAVWLIEHGEEVRLHPSDRTWLLVDLGAGLLEEANAQDVVAELLPDLPAEDQAEIVAKLWAVSHPGVTSFLTALSDHHPVPAVARAARKAAFKARSPAATVD